MNAAQKKGVDFLEIDEVVHWDGKEDLSKLDDDDGEREGEYEVPSPPQFVKTIYEDATEPLSQLALNSNDGDAKKTIETINQAIMANNTARKMKSTALWTIPESFFTPQYSEARKRYDQISANSNDETARKELQTLKGIIDTLIEKHHYLTIWSIPTADDYLKAKLEIQRIKECDPAAPQSILGISDSTDSKGRLTAWRTLGCLVHPRYAKQEGAKDAFESMCLE